MPIKGFGQSKVLVAGKVTIPITLGNKPQATTSQLYNSHLDTLQS